MRFFFAARCTCGPEWESSLPIIGGGVGMTEVLVDGVPELVVDEVLLWVEVVRVETLLVPDVVLLWLEVEDVMDDEPDGDAVLDAELADDPLLDGATEVPDAKLELDEVLLAEEAEVVEDTEADVLLLGIELVDGKVADAIDKAACNVLEDVLEDVLGRSLAPRIPLALTAAPSVLFR